MVWLTIMPVVLVGWVGAVFLYLGRRRSPRVVLLAGVIVDAAVVVYAVLGGTLAVVVWRLWRRLQHSAAVDPGGLLSIDRVGLDRGLFDTSIVAGSALAALGALWAVAAAILLARRSGPRATPGVWLARRSVRS